MDTIPLTISNLDAVSFTRSQRAKYQRITIHPDKTIIVTIPRYGTLKEAKQFLKSKISWIQKHLQKIEQHAQLQDEPNLDVDLEKAKNELFDRLDYFSDIHNFPYNRAAFRCQKTRWGSCSSQDNISLNVNIAFLPAHLQDYILLHELCHTRHKNHRRQFWEELDSCTNSRAKKLSKELKKYNMKLKA